MLKTHPTNIFFWYTQAAPAILLCSFETPTVPLVAPEETWCLIGFGWVLVGWVQETLETVKTLDPQQQFQRKNSMFSPAMSRFYSSHVFQRFHLDYWCFSPHHSVGVLKTVSQRCAERWSYLESMRHSYHLFLMFLYQTMGKGSQILPLVFIHTWLWYMLKTHPTNIFFWYTQAAPAILLCSFQTPTVPFAAPEETRWSRCLLGFGWVLVGWVQETLETVKTLDPQQQIPNYQGHSSLVCQIVFNKPYEQIKH